MLPIQLQSTYQKLADMISEILEVDPQAIDEQTHFGEFGFESVTLSEFAARVNTEFQVNLNPAQLYEYNTVETLAAAILQRTGYTEAKEIAAAIQQPADFSETEKMVGIWDEPQAQTSAPRQRVPGLAELEEELTGLAAEVIGIPADEFQSDEHFGDLGYESVSLGEFSEKITGRYGIEVEPALLYEKNTIRELARYLNSQMAGFNATSWRPSPSDLGQSGRSKADSRGETTHREKKPGAAPAERLIRPNIGEVAIIGMAGIFPQSEDLDEFWNHLVYGDCVISSIPRGREELNKWREELKTAGPWALEPQGGFMKEIDKFDPLFFNISPKEAELMDPQQRLFLEIVWQALEEAGYSKSKMAGSKTGVFVGISSNDYHEISINQGAAVNAFTATGKAYSILANRISFYYDWHGPSQPVDTACSSSLVALHYAVESLRRGESEMAIAGGVNVIISPAFYQSFLDAGMLSPGGRCKTFDKNADGYVRGEGVAALVLKPLDRAARDGDHIYAVIKASAVNHGGRSHSLTAPNPESQAELLLEAYRRSGVDPGTIGYIEAHGTGTKLGDPIEISALKKAFDALYQDWGYLSPGRMHCGIGSVKTNIGHLEAAAGMAGVIKVILALKHRQIPATVNFTQLNPYIKLEDTPFYITDRTRIWEQTYDKKGTATPRRAGISSFGFGGANAHIILEEYLPTEIVGAEVPPDGPQLILISAKNKERLDAYMAKIINFLSGNPDAHAGNLRRLAFTLLTGREAMEERLALVVESLEELREGLDSLRKGLKPDVAYFQGSVTANQAVSHLVYHQEEGREYVRGLFNRREMRTLAKLWVEGAPIDWEDLYAHEQPQRLSLPTYPFAKECYWITGAPNHPENWRAEISGRANLHPLIHQNNSDFLAQRFSSLFTGCEFFLDEHRVGNRRVLPAVAYLEMARAAFDASSGGLVNERSGIIIKNVVWPKLLIVEEQPVQVEVRLTPNEDQEISFEIYQAIGQYSHQVEDQERIIYGQGVITDGLISQRPDVLNIPALKKACNLGQFSQEQCYQAIETMGIHFGPGFRIIETIYQGNHEILARLVLPDTLTGVYQDYFIHPGIVDGALQAQAGFLMSADRSASLPTLVPFNLNELYVYQKPEPKMWAYLRYTEGSRSNAGLRTFDIDLCNDQGIVYMSFKGLSFVRADASHTLESIILHPFWQEAPITPSRENPDYSRRLVILCELEKVDSAYINSRIESRFPGARCLCLQNDRGTNIGQRFTDYGTLILETIRREINEHRRPTTDQPAPKVLIQIVVPDTEEKQALAGFSGMLKTLKQEYPDFTGQTIVFHSNGEKGAAAIVDEVAAILSENSGRPQQDFIRYHEGKRWVREWREWESSSVEIALPWQKGGVYLITGGTGGLGLIFTREILHQTPEATVILTDRFPEDAQVKEKLREFEGQGANIAYYSLDVTDPTQVSQLFKTLKETYGKINGIIHCAGIIRDNYIHKKTNEEFLTVLAPKVTGLVNLDEGARDLELDFLILFSSMASVLGSPGQVDYACANAFMDEYARYRNQLVGQGSRYGKTIVIHWPLWKEGGMRITEENQQLLWENTGLAPLDSAAGIICFYQAMSSGWEECLVLSGNLPRIRALLVKPEPSPIQPATPPPSEGTYPPEITRTGFDGLTNKIRELLKPRISELLKLQSDHINSKLEFSSYGFDSISLTQFANRLNREFQLKIMPTIFFDQSTLDQFAGYLATQYQDYFQTYFKIEAPEAMAQQCAIANTTPIQAHEEEKHPVNRYSKKTAAFSRRSIPDSADATKEIAIIGMSGQFPKADDLDQFWQNLREGVNCITEIPTERWDWREYYGDPSIEPGKTNIKWGGFICGVDEFDPLFFGISPQEADMMDPQQRLLMIHVWKCIEDAGYAPRSFSGTNMAILVGTAHCGYTNLITKMNIPIESNTASGIVPSVGPNRMSYLLNLHGPSEPIETACSSSLVAIHRAIGLLQSGACQLAVTGGVNTMLTPDFHISFSQAGMLAEDGLCKTFSEKADGYARGEGVGMLLLKPLVAAERDGDHIYGIILSSAENHGGRANSFTAPNPKAQAELLKEAYRKAGIDPRTVTYIEAHGTGTKLGDPVEIEGLKTAFKDLYQDAGISQAQEAYCGLGSVKTNIGHLELAAGIAGVIKVLLQLKNKTLAPSLHCETVNPYIQLDDSPFYIARETKEWMALKDERGRSIPRRAGVSSFGFGGVNSHVVIEEYIPKNDIPQETQNNTKLLVGARRDPVLIILSAKNEERLAEQAGQLLDAIASAQWGDSDLGNMAFTLQVGRDAMEERLSLVVGSIEELKQGLMAFLKQSDPPCPVFHDNIEKKRLDSFFDNQESLDYLVKLYENRKLATLAKLWVEGVIIPWEILCKNKGFTRISLPAYPFAKEKYWLPHNEKNQYCAAEFVPGSPVLHPLVHQNTSTLSEQRFSSMLTPDMLFVRDDGVEGQRFFPEMAYLEMARAAVAQAADAPVIDALAKGGMGIRLNDVVWDQPIILKDHPLQAHISLFPGSAFKKGDAVAIDYEVYSEMEGNDEALVHCQGSAVIAPLFAAESLDLANLQTQCNQLTISAQRCSEIFQLMKDDSQKARGIETIFIGFGQALAKIALPVSMNDSLEQFILHPVIMDAVVSAASIFIIETGIRKSLAPVTLQEIEISGKCETPMWAWVRFSKDTVAGANLPKLDIDLADDQGTVQIRLKRLELREINAPVAPVSKVLEDSQLLAFQEVWQEQELASPVSGQTSARNMKTMVCFLSNPENQQEICKTMTSPGAQTGPGCKLIFVSRDTVSKDDVSQDAVNKPSRQTYHISRADGHDYQEVFRDIWKEDEEVDAVLYLWPLEDSYERARGCIEDYDCIVYMLQGLNAAKLKTKRILFAAKIKNGLERCYLESWLGFERSLRMVLPGTQVAVIGWEGVQGAPHHEGNPQIPENPMKDWWPKLRAELEAPVIQSALYQDGKRYVCQVRPVTIPPGNYPLKSGGTYLITGGFGGLGFLIAKHLAGIQPVNLILIGRSALDAEKQLKMKTLQDLGSRVSYLQTDVSDPIALKEEIIQTKKHFGEINGVIHTAGIIRTQNIFETDFEGFQSVLAPKITGTLGLDEALKDEPLDFVCYFSSSAAFLGDFGSCDYAIANRFQTAFAHYRNQQQLKEGRPGKTIAISWPLWRDNGMISIDDPKTQMYLTSSGQGILESSEGLAMFHRILAQNETQYLILIGQPDRIYQFLGLKEGSRALTRQSVGPGLALNSSGVKRSAGASLERERRPEMKGLSIEQRLEWDLKENINKLLRISREKIDREKNLADFGFNSISLNQFAIRLIKHFGIEEITPALFFRYSTLEKLTQYFLTEHMEAVYQFYGEVAPETGVAPEIGASPETVASASTGEPVNSAWEAQAPPPGVRERLTRKRRFLERSSVSDSLEPIAIIGMSGRFPGARNIDELWTILANGENMVREIPEERFDWRQYYGDPLQEPGKTNGKWCGCIPGADEFDPLFFEISPLEAETMDPRQRLLLQEAWKSLEDAGYGPEQLKNQKIGMFVGVEQGDYQTLTGGAGNIVANHTGILAARLAYFLNLGGPVMAIDTACSSGLVAAHQAVLSLRSHECDTAIAAGVNLLLTPLLFIGLGQAGMLSPDGKCYAFDKRANGMVPGEAVAALVFKRLSQAEADGDPIYAVITGSGINYDGKTNGITAPSGIGQTNLLKTVYDQHRINPEEIDYIITHGTGTRLGDPVEINALDDAFKTYTRKQGYCAITSTKTNFGHTFAASGLVSLISLVQALRYETIPASLHCEQENDYIQWKESPFYVNKTKRLWYGAAGGGGRARTGAVSAFGMSGTNAHMVVQSYSVKENSGSRDRAPYYLLVLSAKTQEALAEKLQDLIGVLENGDLQTQDLSQMSYTLLTGRHHFQHRCAIVFREREDALFGLRQMLNKERLPNLFQGQVPRDFSGQKATQQYLQDLLAQSRAERGNSEKYREILFALADLYCQGYGADWTLLFSAMKLSRIHLPTYPFAREHYWFQEHHGTSGYGRAPVETAPKWANHDTSLQGRGMPAIHPLLHQNTSGFSEQRYSSIFTGNEFFLADHVVKGRRVLPGVAYLEMVRAAVGAALSNAESTALEAGQIGIRLRNIEWMIPVIIGDQPPEIYCGLYPEDNGEIRYQIYSLPTEDVPEDETEPVVHSQGSVILDRIAPVEPVNISALQARCSQGLMESTEVYEAFKKLGIDYGPGHQGIEMLYVGQDEVLAKLALPVTILDTGSQFVLHPSLMDAALQAAIGLTPGAGDSRLPATGVNAPRPPMPFALQELEIYGKCTANMWAFVRYSEPPDSRAHGAVNQRDTGLRIQKLDVDLYDDQGGIRVRLKGFVSRVLEGELQTGIPEVQVVESSVTDPQLTTAMKTTILTPVWDRVPVEKGQSFPAPTEGVVILGGTKDNQRIIKQHFSQAKVIKIQPEDTARAIAKKLESYGNIDHLFWIAPYHPLRTLADDSLIEEQNQGVLQVFRIIKALFLLGYSSKDLGWSVITTQSQPALGENGVNPAHASLYGLMGSLAKEYLNWKIRVIDLDEGTSMGKDWPMMDILALPPDPKGEPLIYRNGEWYRERLIPCQLPSRDRTLYRTGGVYVVIGGAGGIGEVWSEYMIRTYQAQIVWIGRRQPDTAIQAKLDRLGRLGPIPQYIATDATDRKALQRAYEAIKERHAMVHGVVHAAIVLLDRSLANMEEEQFRAGLAAKVEVSVRMAQVFRKEPLDFVMFFSSLQTYVKAPGQSNYAAGSTFKDAFARRLASEWPCAVKTINFGFWGSVGVVASEKYLERMAKAGIGSIEPPEAMAALEMLLAGPLDQLGLMKTSKPVEDLDITPDLLTVYPPAPLPDIQTIKNHFTCPASLLSIVKAPLASSGRNTVRREMEALLAKLLWSQLRTMGLFTGKQFAANDLFKNSGLLEMYERWFSETIAVLIRHNYLTYDGKCAHTYGVRDEAFEDVSEVWREWDLKKATWLTDPDWKAQIVFGETMMRALPEILTGKVPATDIMFPNSSMELVEGLYKNNLVKDAFNEAVADFIVTYIQERLKLDAGAQIRMIEIGAGTGGTSSMVFQKLKPYHEHIQEYCYTDISKAFLIRAETKYGPQNPFLTYQVFNAEYPPAGQGIQVGEYDLAIATDVLHATRNIRQTLRHVKAVLKNQGLLLLNEMSDNMVLAQVTFGLLEGWWRYEDPALRIPGCPGLYPQIWKTVLESEGFQAVDFPVPDAEILGQQMMVASSDGIVRQPFIAENAAKPEVIPVKPKVKTIAMETPSRTPAFESGAMENRATEGKVPAIQPPFIIQTKGAGLDVLRAKSTAYFQKMISETLKVPYDKFDTAAPLETYGMDSIMVVQMNNVMRNVFGNISSTLFFEYDTIDALVEYFLNTQKDVLIRLTGFQEPVVPESVPIAAPLSISPELVNPEPVFRRPGRYRQIQVHEPEITLHGQEGDIAIIGLAGRYPGAKNIDELWQNLRAGKDCITEIPIERWDYRTYYDPDKQKPGKTCCKWGGFLEGIDRFDPLFFHISPREAEFMDPQERLFLETVWNLFESTGLTRDKLQQLYQGKVGVYVGAMYQLYHLREPDVINDSGMVLSSYSAIANRISYFFNFQGPSIAIDTACSSSAIAIHMACESLIKGECQLAVAGGVNLSLHPKKYLGLSLTQMIASHTDSRSFADGDGMLPAEGVGAVLLKPLSLAAKDGDTILAVIKSTATNHGGHTSAYSVPNLNGQAQLVEDNFRKSGIDPRTISYVEAAANGSALGDAIELNALTKAFNKFTSHQQFCAIGSIKSNIGHAEAASGISQLTKVILQLQHKQLVPSIKAERLNPNIDFLNTPFYLQRELQDWEQPVTSINGMDRTCPRRATVSSFGAGGSNAHIIIEEYIPVPVEKVTFPAAAGPQIAVFSAKNKNRLQELVRRHLEFIELQPGLSLPDLAYTLQVGREPMESRLAIVVSTIQELRQTLKNYLASAFGEMPPSTLVFSGNVEDDHQEVRRLLAGKIGEIFVQTLVQAKDFEKIALHWTQGGKIPWEALHEGQTVRMIPLPTYPFEQRRFWIETESKPAVNRLVNQEKLAGEPLPTMASPARPILQTPQPVSSGGTSLPKRVIDILCGLLGITATEFEINRPLYQYGFDSILRMSLFAKLESQLKIPVNLDELKAAETAREIINILSPNQIAQKAAASISAPIEPQSLIAVSSIPEFTPEFDETNFEEQFDFPELFPELIHLNQVTEGRPVFWFHAALGGVEVYHELAQRSGRPFYGIQARGWMNERAPLIGIPAMAAYYIDVIRSLQPEGPYDLGGYSVGGAIAYEVTRRLQVMGQAVSSIVMIDSIYDETAGDEPENDQDLNWKDTLLLTVNMLLALNRAESGDLPAALIHRDKLDLNSDKDLYLRQAFQQARQLGLNKTENQLMALVLQNLKVQRSYIEKFIVLPLPRPDGLKCYYFRNHSRSFYGPMAPYFTIKRDGMSVDNQEYWQEWQNQIKDFQMIDLNSSSHIMMLSERQTVDPLLAFSEELYTNPNSKKDIHRPKAPNIKEDGIHQIAILAFGSRGDVHPVIALGKGLERSGYTVTIAAVNEYRELITNNGLRFASLGLSAADLSLNFLDSRRRENNLPQAVSRDAKQALARSIIRWLDSSYEACRGCDLLLYTGMAYYHGMHVAEKLKVPSIPVYLQPITENWSTNTFLMPDLKLGPWYNRWSYRVAEELIWRYLGVPINRWRTQNGLASLSAAEVFTMKHRSLTPVIYAFSSLIYPKPAQWGEHVLLPGYFFLERNEDWRPAPKLARFLEAGPAPVYIGFGSMNDYIGRRTTELSLEALKQTGERILLSVGWENVKEEDLSENIFITGYAPHHWLFPQMKAVIHHGGAGTTAAVLQAGIPSVIIPLMLDQPFWGNHLYHLGVCPKPIPFRDLTSAKLYHALQKALYDETIRNKAAELGRLLQSENGVANAVGEINRLVAQWEKKR